jgi:lipoprotein-anchoring transpeptidase ErfK/SrfK
MAGLREVLSRRPATVAAALAGVIVVGAGSWLAMSGGSGAPAPVARPSSAPVTTPPGKGAHPAPAASAGVTQVAIVLANSPRYDSPNHRVAGTVLSTWEYRPSILPVIATRPGWVRVRLPQRPNGSTSWLPADDVALNVTTYRIVVNVTRKRLALYNHGKLVFTAPAGIGTTTDPTPRGHYFLAFDEAPPQPNPGYGPFIMVTSAHSPNIADWEGSGDALIGIHGPLGEDTAIGAGGARISHGCIRLHEPAQVKLRAVPPGTPIDIVAS